MSTLISKSAPPVVIDFWPRFLLFPLLAIILYPPFLLGWGGDAWYVQTLWVVVLTFCWYCVGGSFHEAAHQTLFRSPAWNTFYGRVLGLMIGIPFTAYKETHRRHHACLNTADDYELWPYCDPQCSLAFRRAFVWVDLILGVLTNPYIYGRIYFTGDPRLSPQVRRTISWEYAAQVMYWILFLAGVYWVGTVNQFNWTEFRFVWILPLLLSPMVNTGRKFVEHLGLTSRDPLAGTRTIVGSNWWTRLMCYFNFDIAIHGPHHRFPRAHHYELAGKLSNHLNKHPEAVAPQFGTYLAAIVDTIPHLWFNPATGDHRIQSQEVSEKLVAPSDSADHAIAVEAPPRRPQ